MGKSNKSNDMWNDGSKSKGSKHRDSKKYSFVSPVKSAVKVTVKPESDDYSIPDYKKK